MVSSYFRSDADFFSLLIFNSIGSTTHIFRGIFIAPCLSGMNLRDLIIIYLACGAPFGVYYLLQNRNIAEKKFLWLESLFRFVFWIPYALLLVARKSIFTKLYTIGFVKFHVSDARKESEIEKIKRFLEKFLVDRDLELSIYEFRETFERYVGLTLELQAGDQVGAAADKEIFRITDHPNKKLAAICLHRNNRKRLSFHHKLARQNFFDVLDVFANHRLESQNLFSETLKLSLLLNDFEAQAKLKNLSKESWQTPEKPNVNDLEQGLWQPEKQQPSPANRISSNLQIMSATANVSNND